MLYIAQSEDRNVLKNMRSEFRHRLKYSSDIFIDAVATKTIFEQTALRTNGKIKGYFSNVGLDPYGFLLFSEIQV